MCSFFYNAPHWKRQIGKMGPVKKTLRNDTSLKCYPFVKDSLYKITMLSIQYKSMCTDITLPSNMASDCADRPGYPGQSRAPCAYAVIMRLTTNGVVHGETISPNNVKNACINEYWVPLLWKPPCWRAAWRHIWDRSYICICVHPCRYILCLHTFNCVLMAGFPQNTTHLGPLFTKGKNRLPLFTVRIFPTFNPHILNVELFERSLILSKVKVLTLKISQDGKNTKFLWILWPWIAVCV